MNLDYLYVTNELAKIRAKAELGEKGLLELLVLLVKKGILTKEDIEIFKEGLKK